MLTKKGKKVGLQRYIFFVQYVVAVMTYTNAQRTGAVVNMHLKEYRHVIKKGDVDGEYVVHVWHHKTVDSHSCADVIFGPELAQLLKEYMSVLQLSTGCKNLFVQHNREPMLSKNSCADMKKLVARLKIRLPTATAACKLSSRKTRVKLSEKETIQVAKAMGNLAIQHKWLPDITKISQVPALQERRLSS